MKINETSALNLWNREYGNATTAKDFAGRTMKKNEYGNNKSEYGWNLDHVKPVSAGGKTKSYNLVCCNIKTNSEKSNDYPLFVSNGKYFSVEGTDENCRITKLAASTTALKKKDINFYDLKEVSDFWKNECLKKASEPERTSHVSVGITVTAYEQLFTKENLRKCTAFLSEFFKPMKVYVNENFDTERDDGKKLCVINIVDLDNNIDVDECRKKCRLLEMYAMYLRYEYFMKIEIHCIECEYESELEKYNDIFNNENNFIFMKSYKIGIKGDDLAFISDDDPDELYMTEENLCE